MNFAVIAKGVSAGAMDPTAASAVAGSKAFLVSLYLHEKGDSSHFMADQSSVLDEKTNKSSLLYPVIP